MCDKRDSVYSDILHASRGNVEKLSADLNISRNDMIKIVNESHGRVLISRLLDLFCHFTIAILLLQVCLQTRNSSIAINGYKVNAVL